MNYHPLDLTLIDDIVLPLGTPDRERTVSAIAARRGRSESAALRDLRRLHEHRPSLVSQWREHTGQELWGATVWGIDLRCGAPD